MFTTDPEVMFDKEFYEVMESVGEVVVPIYRTGKDLNLTSTILVKSKPAAEDPATGILE